MRRVIWTAALAACTGEPAGEPSLAIVAPADEATVCGTPLEVELDVRDFELVPIEEGSEPEPGSGHVDVYLNGQSATMTSETTFTIEDVVDGAYQLRADLVRADHKALEPYVGDFVYVTVSSEACAD